MASLGHNELMQYTILLQFSYIHHTSLDPLCDTIIFHHFFHFNVSGNLLFSENFSIIALCIVDSPDQWILCRGRYYSCHLIYHDPIYNDMAYSSMMPTVQLGSDLELTKDTSYRWVNARKM